MTQTQQLQTQQDFELPVKRVEGDTLKERMTVNAYERILPARYLLRDEERNVIETPEELFRRVAEDIAEADREYMDYETAVEQYESLMTNLKFMPNSPTLMNAGDELQQLSACFVVHPEDDMHSIFDTAKNAALIHKSGGGTGYPFHLLRPKGDKVGSTGGIASGPMSFMQVFDTVCGTVKQGGKRRGAQMGIMRVDHPDVLRFVVSKRSEDNLTNFNISVGLTEGFMEAVKNDEEYELINPRTGEPFEVSEQTQQFYNTDEEYYPTAAGSDQGRDDNFWRDYADSFEELSDYDIELEEGEPMSLPAKFIWECLVDSAWTKGEPGLFMYDEANEMHSFDVEEHPEHKIEATNPCVTGDTFISTGNGMYRAEELYEQKIANNVVVDSRQSDEKVKEASSVYKTGTKEVYRLQTQEGFDLRLTADHRVMTEDGWKEAQELSEGDDIHVLDREGCFGSGGTREEGQVLGWLVGDGQMKEKEERAVLHFYDRDTELAEDFAEKVNHIVREPEGNANYEIGVQHIQRREGHRQAMAAKEQRVRSERLYELADEYGLASAKRQVPDRVFRSSQTMAQGFLQGLFTADGSVQGTIEKGVQIRLSSSRKQLLKQTQQLLLNFGIYSKIYENRRDAGKRELPDGKGGVKEYDIDPQHDLVISKDSLERFQETIGFLREEKSEKLAEKLDAYTRGPYTEDRTATVEAVEFDGREDVYDLTEPDTHSFVANGLVVHNCGEQPLENNEACNLGHINLSLLAEEKEDGMALHWEEWKTEHQELVQNNKEQAVQQFLHESLDMEEFERIATIGTRFLDNVVTRSDFPLDEIEETVSSLRKVGLGIMGFAQLLIQLGIEYGSEESQYAAKEIQRLVTRFSVEASHELAKERGAFDEWENSKWAEPTAYPDWFERYSGGMDPQQHEDGLKLRNHNTVTIAPTGTTSMIGDTSGGCEPIFSLAYFKNVGKDIQGEDMLVEFDDYFIRTLEANNIDVEEVKEEAEQLMRDNEWDGVDSLPDDVLPPHVKDLFKTADSVTAEEHVDIQAAFQTYNHSGISKTCNFPHEATREDVANAFMRAYEKGCKGLTVYRDGTRDVQVMTTREDNRIEEQDAEELADDIEEQYGSVSDFLDEAGITVKSVADSTPRNRPQIISGTTQKIDTGYGGMYVTINEDEEGIFEIFTQMGKSGGFTHSLTEAISRLTSLALRSDVDPREVQDQLEGIRSPRVAWDNSEQVLSIPDGVAKALERYMDGEANQVQSSMTSFSSDTEDGDASDAEKLVESGKNPECPECGGMLSYGEGCVKCEACGYSKCG